MGSCIILRNSQPTHLSIAAIDLGEHQPGVSIKPLRKLPMAGLPHSNRFASGNAAINEIERRFHEQNSARSNPAN
jgi:hypothetical protein